MESGVNAGSGAPCSYPQSWGTVPMLHYGVRRSVLVNLDLEVRVCFQQSLLHYPREPSADSLIPSNQSTTFIQTFISCHLDPLSATNLCYTFFTNYYSSYAINVYVKFPFFSILLIVMIAVIAINGAGIDFGKGTTDIMYDSFSLKLYLFNA